MAEDSRGGNNQLVPHTTLGALIDRFEAIVFDSDGVLTRWPSAIPDAPEAISHLNRLRKPYFVLTNDSSALPETRAARYGKLGLEIDAARIITSGMLLRRFFQERSLSGARCVVLGTEDSAEYARQAGGQVVPLETGSRETESGPDFEVLVIGDQDGYPFLESADQVLSSLFRNIDRGELPFLALPNPDLVYPVGGGFGFASGTVAKMFEAALAQRYPHRPDLKFTRLGKPHPAMFEEVIRRSGARNIVMIGDTPATDIRGANGMGITSALLDTGLAVPDLSALPESDVPTYRMRSLAL